MSHAAPQPPAGDPEPPPGRSEPPPSAPRPSPSEPEPAPLAAGAPGPAETAETAEHPKSTQAREPAGPPGAAGRADQAMLDAWLAGLVDGRQPEDAARVLALLANRAAGRLHALSREQATARRGQPAWPAWAALQNATRGLVLQASTCRDLAARLPGPH